ncbi:flagellar hook-basal body complex protein FliE [Sphaerobacter sp.]|uniref:flagellar hook-basal body complex protein FliE n=1 Tax=Sphaerobacter sp. TaxID=2099654 RepID=UPI001DE6C1C0|nr:flagellar hook-basal body complex protein FliE [Sphaerobacter sp.]MBX5446027.1 flagellar hook-basal body complex protein FliE [Sphaerobacter sp.]
MNVPPINPVAVDASTAIVQPRSTQPVGGASFTDMIEKAIGDLNQSLNLADDLAVRLAAGEDVDLHEVMIALEAAGIGLQTAIQIRNRVVEAYKEIMAMPV